MDEPVYVEISRVWPMARKYETYRVTIRVPVTSDKEEAVLIAARYAAKQAHIAWGEYQAQYESINKPGGDFRTAKEAIEADLPRGKGAEQGPSHGADSPTPEPAGAGVSAGAEEPEAPPAKGLVPPFAVGEPPSGSGPGNVTEGQLEALHTLMARSTWASELVRKALVNLKVAQIEQVSTEAAAALIGKLNRGQDG